MGNVTKTIERFEEVVAEIYGDVYTSLTSDKERDNFWDKLPTNEKYKIECILQKERGIGNDYFTINEPGESEKDIKSKTILEWDMGNWNFQKEHSEKEKYESIYTKFDYYPIMQWDWVRWIENDKLTYGFLSSLEHHLLGEANTWICDLQRELIPHKHNSLLIEGDSEYKRYRMEVDAYGREKEYEKFSKRLSNFEVDELIIIIKDIVKNTPDMIWRKDVFEDEFDRDSYIVFSNKNVCGAVTFESFLNDINKFPGDDKILEEYVETLKEVVLNKVIEIYNEIKESV